MPKVKKHKHAKKPRKRINKSIYKSNINKQHVKVNVNTGSTPSGISYMQAPAYPSLMDINTAVKGTVEELLKNHHQAEPKPIVNNSPLNNFENRNRNVSILSQIVDENKVNSFEDTFNDYDKGSIINSDDFDDDYKDLFLKPGNEFGDFFNTPFKIKKMNCYCLHLN